MALVLKYVKSCQTNRSMRRTPEGPPTCRRRRSPHHALVVGCHLLAVRHQQLTTFLIPAGSAEGTFGKACACSFSLSCHD